MAAFAFDMDCPQRPEEGDPIFFPDPYNCSCYYECSIEGVPIHQNCPPGLEWSQEKHVCDWPINANCHAESTTMEPTTMEPTATTA